MSYSFADTFLFFPTVQANNKHTVEMDTHYTRQYHHCRLQINDQDAVFMIQTYFGTNNIIYALEFSPTAVPASADQRQTVFSQLFVQQSHKLIYFSLGSLGLEPGIAVIVMSDVCMLQ